MEIQSLFNKTCYLNKVPKFKCIHLGFAQVEDSRDSGNLKKITEFFWKIQISVDHEKSYLIFPHFRDFPQNLSSPDFSSLCEPFLI